MDQDAKKVVVIGQGYVGLPVAMRAVDVGYNVVGIDLDSRRVNALQRGESFVDDVPGETLQAALNTGRYVASTDYAPSEGFDIAVITVPTPLTDSLPDLSFIEASGASLAPHLRPGATVILESTTYPGTTEELLVPILEQGSGLKARKDFHVGYSPERIDPGNPTWGFVNTPKVVSGLTPQCLTKVEAFYNSLVDTTVRVSSTREAELAKLLENTFRHVNIALVNELAMFARELNVDVWEAIDAAATKPFGFMKFTPGPGVGGHCLPVDPSYLSWQVRKSLGRSFRFVELANDVNDHMPDYVAERALRLLNDQGKAVRGARIVILGVAYKRDSGDVRESPSLKIMELLKSFGADIVATDPHVIDHRWPSSVTRDELTADLLREADLVILVTDHSAFDLSLLDGIDSPILDTRNVLLGERVTRL
ncbi:nucleotide sugar dehydrogenase [Microbacterium sp. Re1]|uniref:Nucleotide sugar dehydrogenase n=1 Tax=Microbacterium commune TaxID=2762219 RepID=A0ABR8W2Q7_9MICO|nr:nucleotide sugar dehydrogenase [Microbacterium commune]MBD8011310.1 nucleotide sugar dehydrogenase [Microbacterium commune]